MKIGEAAKETGLSISNIRFYERKGLLCPRRKEESQYREYEPEDIRRLKEIMLLRKMGISVESIYLLYEGQTKLLGLLERQEKELAEQMDETWYQFSEGAVSLEYPDYFDLDFRCADYAGERLLVMNQTDGLGKRRPSVFFSREKI